METQQLIGVIALFGATLLGILGYLYFARVQRQNSLRSLIGNASGRPSSPGQSTSSRRDGPVDFDQAQKQAKKVVAKRVELSVDDRLFQAGMFTDEDRRDYYRQQTILPLLLVAVSVTVGVLTGQDVTMLAVVVFFAGAVGYRWPNIRLDSKIKARGEDLMYYLPLVIEQVVIGVSSSLDIGPCLQRVVQMADERDSHNSVTELLKIVQYYVRSGIPLEEALTEVGKRSGHTELKHAFMSLAQTSRHGGEVTKQLQELADAVSSQRETRIEAKIKKLELEATAPVAVVFVGFMGIFLSSLAVQLMTAFKN